MNLKNVFPKDKKILIPLTLALLGVVFIFFGSQPVKKKTEVVGNELDSYIADLEKRLCAAVSEMKGAGKTEVFITAESGFESVYVNNASIDESGDERRNTKKELAYMTSASNNKEPVVVKKLTPKISGVLVVCEGGSNALLASEIQRAVSVAAGISEDKIYVTGGG